MRLDLLLLNRGLVKSRTEAKELILQGGAVVNGAPAAKPSLNVSKSAEIKLIKSREFVSRGGIKLDGALKRFSIGVKGLVCADFGASTGGFCDCLLKHGASKIYAIDSGTGQLAGELSGNPKIINLEKTNVKDVTRETLGEQVSFISADLSFISVTYAIKPIKSVLAQGGCGVILIKPQFEAGRASLNKNGIVTDKKVHISALTYVTDAFITAGFCLVGLMPSPIHGGDGNIEYLLYFKRVTGDSSIDIKGAVDEAFLKRNNK